jgi:thiol:disulfide interchange protein
MSEIAVSIFTAFLGGLLLNVMPCVFPIISLKAMQIMQGGNSAKELKIHSILFTSGVLISFWLVVGILILLRAGGQQIGWGFQLQYPGFVIFIAIILFIWSLNLLDVFSFGTKLQSVAGGVNIPKGQMGAFMTGVIATLIATPCTAPFMGTAISFALSLSWYYSLAIFSSLALGMSLPYLLLGFIPKLATYLPRPGAWMEIMKKLLAFPLFITSWWLIGVYYDQMGDKALFAVLLSLILISLASFIYGLSQYPSRSRNNRFILRTISLGILAFSTMHVASQEKLNTTVVSSTKKTLWQPYSAQNLLQFINQKKPVFIDFTASWCITCQLNKKTVLSTSTMSEYFLRKGIITMRADWTNQDEEITKALQSLGRDGVPVYAFYYPGSDNKPYLFPTILTSDSVKSTIDSLLF